MPPLSYARTKDDWSAFVGQASRRALGYWIWLPLGAIVAGVVGLVAVLSIRGGGPVAFYEIIGTATYCAIVSIVFSGVSSDRYVRENGSVLGDRTVVLTDAGIEDQGLHSRATYSWSAIEEVSANETLVVLWTDPAAGVFLPKRSFSSNEDIAAFVAYAKERIARARHHAV